MTQRKGLRRNPSLPGRLIQPIMGGGNAYLPRQAYIKRIIKENSTVKTLECVFEDEIFNTNFTYLPGQFMMLSVPHCGEAPISLSSSPTQPGSFDLSIRKAGKLTGAVHDLRTGDMVGVRGPYGRPFPMDDLRGHNLLFVAGGIGMAPLRSAIRFCLDKAEDYGDITVLYGCKHPHEICFNSDLAGWRQSGLVRCLLTVDEGNRDWDGRVGLVTGLLDEVDLDGANDKAIVCGPGVMIRFVLQRLEAMGFHDTNMITTLERHMKCGIGICGHCHFEGKMVCTDGPIFTRAELPDLEVL